VLADYGALRLEVSGHLAVATIDHPPTNLVDGPFIAAIDALVDTLGDPEVETPVVAVVFVSADPDFFLMHGDVTVLAETPLYTHEPSGEPNRAATSFQRLAEAPFVSIGVIEGAARGGGCEFHSALDLRYGTEHTVIGQPEVAMGILPGAGGTTRLPRIVGRSAALEMILTGRDLDAQEALASGWLSALYPPADIRRHVMALAERIAAMPPASVAATKRVVAVALQDPAAALVEESNALGQLMAAGAHHEPMRRFLAAGGQTRAGELQGFGPLIAAMLDGP
jgi:enoyl-CoA hydratase/carnithine racemase